MMKTPSYPFRMLSLFFWIIVIVAFRNSAVANFLFGNSISWPVCALDIFILWLLTIVVRTYGFKIIPALFKDIIGNLIRQLPLLAVGIVIIAIGRAHSSSLLISIGVAFEFFVIWVISWPKYTSPSTKKIMKPKK